MRHKMIVFVLATLFVVLLIAGSKLLVQPAQAALGSPTYKVIESPGRDVPVAQYEKILNDMAASGWEFDNWLYRGSAQTPDLIFKKR